VTIPVTIGYETYGTLNQKKSNAILLCHHFTGTGHAAGDYVTSDARPGWWDALVGPGKAIDTDRHFVICSDTIANINAHDPHVITTGPATINPATGKEYALSFPIFSLKDVVRLQKKLLESLGIERLVMVGGPSMGGLQAFMWGRYFPGVADRILAVCATPMLRPYGIMIPNQLAIDAIMLDPDWNDGNYYGRQPPQKGLFLAFKILLIATRTDHWAERRFGRQFADATFKDYSDPRKSFYGKYLVEKEVERTVLEHLHFFDANSYLYTAKANTLFDLREHGESLERALGRISAKTLMIIDESDLVFTREQAEEARRSMKECECFFYNSGNGHLSSVNEHSHFVDKVKSFAG